MDKQSKIYIAGSQGMVGRALTRVFKEQGYHNLLTPSRDELDLFLQPDVNQFFKTQKPDIVVIAAAKVGGIMANNTYRADFLMDNLLIEVNLIRASHIYGVKKLLFLGSSCIYPKEAPQPLKEEYLLTAPLEATNEPYAIAKIAGLKLCEAYHDQYGDAFYSVMPTNLYGSFDNFDLKSSHVLPALIRKMHEAKVSNAPSVELWGTGKPLREFLYVDDLARACLFLLEGDYKPRWLNVGSGEEFTIAEMAKQVAEVVGFTGNIVFNSQYPDGTMRKRLDSSALMALGFKNKTPFQKGLQLTYQWFLSAQASLPT